MNPFIVYSEGEPDNEPMGRITEGRHTFWVGRLLDIRNPEKEGSMTRKIPQADLQLLVPAASVGSSLLLVNLRGVVQRSGCS